MAEHANVQKSRKQTKHNPASESQLPSTQNHLKVAADRYSLRRDDLDDKSEQLSQSEISSLSEQEEEERQRRYNDVIKHIKQTIRRSRSQSSSESENSIDLIGQRIRKLQIDLSEKIDERKNSQLRKQHNQAGQRKQAVKLDSLGSPPLPKKKLVSKQAVGKQATRVRKTTDGSSQNNLSNRFSEHKLARQNKLGDASKRKSEKLLQKQSKIASKKQIIKPIDKSSPKLLQKHRERSKDDYDVPNSDIELEVAQQQISKLQKVVETLRHENTYLKDQVRKKEEKQQKKQMQMNMGVFSANAKLQKQIQTLKALEALQKKLKKSISRKQKAGWPKKVPSGLQAGLRGS